MNKKLLVLAVAGAVATPMLANAQSDGLRIYGRVGTSITYEDRSYDYPNADEAREDSSRIDLDDYSSRLGLRYDSSIGYGMAVHGQYEFSLFGDREADDEGDAVSDVRIASVGISGDFGRIDLGNLWSAYYNAVGGNIDAMGMIYETIAQGPFRSSNTIKYSNAFGPVDLEVDLRLRDDKSDGGPSGDQTEMLSGNGFGVGVTFSPMNRLSVGVAYDSESVDDDYADAADGDEVTRFGVSGAYQFGAVTAKAGWQQASDDRMGGEDISSYYLSADGSISEATTWRVGYAVGESLYEAGNDDVRANEDSDQLFYGVYHALGGGFLLFYEGSFETAGSNDGDQAGYEQFEQEIGMQVDF